MYYTFKEQTHTSIILKRDDGSLVVFIEGGDGPEAYQYAMWIAEGNTAEEWQPDTTPGQVTAEEPVVDESAVNDAE